MNHTEILIKLHFQGRFFCCESCEDMRIGVCPGRGLKGYEAIKRCMVGKDVVFDSSSPFAGFDQR